MDIVSYVRGAQALRNVRILDQSIVGAQAEGTFTSVDERLKWLEKQTANSLYTENVAIDLVTGSRTNIKAGLPLTLVDEKVQGIYISDIIDLGAYHKERKTLSALLTDAGITENNQPTYDNASIKIEYQASSNSTTWYGYYTAAIDQGLTHKTDTYPSYRYMRIKITITPIKEEIYDEDNALQGEKYNYHKVEGIHIHRTCLSPVGLLYKLDSAVMVESMKLDFKVAQLINKSDDTYQTHLIYADSEQIQLQDELIYDEDKGAIVGRGSFIIEGLFSPIAIRSIGLAIMDEVEEIAIDQQGWQPISGNAITKLTMATKSLRLRITLKEGQAFHGLALSWLFTL